MGCCASSRKLQGRTQLIENGGGNSVDSATRPSTMPVAPVSISDITTQPNALIQPSTSQAQVRFDLPTPSNVIDGNFAPGAVQPVTTDTHGTQPVAFDVDPFSIPSASIKKSSGFPASSGGLGDIWQCSMIVDPATPTEVAVKTIRIADIRNEAAVQKAKKRLRREVAVWIRLKHAHIVTLHGTVSGFGTLPALVSTWMHNGALSGYLERTSLTMGQKLKLLKQVVDGLRYLHEQKVIHGDLTSTNVVIDRDGNAFLTDFGLSVALSEGDKSYYNTHSNAAIRWLAPELTGSPEPESDFDFTKPNSQSDIFSLGCIMLHVFSGKLPFWWLKSVPHIFSAQFNRVEPYRPEPGVIVDHQHLDFMRKCWSPKPEVRPSIGDAASFVEDELARVFSTVRLAQ